MSTERRQDWVVGMDLSTRSHGALRFARWLRTRSAGRLRMLPMFVATDARIGFNNELGSGPEIEAHRLEAAKILTTLGVEDDLLPLEATHGAPERVLPDTVAQRALGGLLIGRAAKAKERWSFASLGATARRILRHLSSPVGIVPPDFEPATDASSGGPVLVGVAPDETSVEAVEFAHRLAQTIDVPLLAIHARDERNDEQMDIHDWVRVHEFTDIPLQETRGHPAWVLYEESKARSSPFLVCGTRRLSATKRVFSASVSHDLAAHAEVPVFIVPPSPALDRP